MNDLSSLLPTLNISMLEIVVFGIMLLVLVCDFWNYKNKFTTLLTISTVGLLATLGYLFFRSQDLIGTGFSGLYSVSPLDLFFKGVLLVGSFAIILMLGSNQKNKSTNLVQGEPILLILLGLLGSLFVASSNELITLFISIEILSFSSYILTAYVKTNKQSVEAGMKYLILGSLSSGFLIFGIALIYGITGSTQFDTIHQILLTQNTSLPVWIAFLFIFTGISFKMGIFPFQFWIPDVYEGAVIWVSAFLSTVSKAAGFIAFIKIIGVLGIVLTPYLYTFFGILIILTVLYGNLGALLQNNLKRLLGYSSIAQAGYLLLALTNTQSYGINSVAFYLAVYVLSNLLVFIVIYLASSKSEDRLSLHGLSQRSFLLAACLFIGITSLAGIPPMAGFIGKFVLFLAAFRAKAYIPIAFALTGVLISMFYYYRVIRAAFITIPEAEVKYSLIKLSPLAIITLVSLAASIIILGIFPAPLFDYLF